MLGAISYEDVCKHIGVTCGDYGWNEAPEGGSKRRMVGLLFAPVGQPIAKAEIIPRLKDFHYRSGNHINFYCAGYAGEHPPQGRSPREGEGPV
jgi:hypothetical protein